VLSTANKLLLYHSSVSVIILINLKKIK